MKTQVFSARAFPRDRRAIDACADILRRGGLVAFPTETVYGLGADARQADALRAIFAAKGRPGDNPLIVHAASAESALGLAAGVDDQVWRLARAFWPGPLTMVLSRGEGICDEISAGLDTVGVRVPDHPVALALLEVFGGPVAAPSANLSGRPSPTTAQHVLDDLKGVIDAVLDGGKTGVGLESTVIDLTGDVPTVLRVGGLPIEALQGVLGRVDVAGGIRDKSPADVSGPVPSPGMKYKHYSPQAPLFILSGDQDEIVQAVSTLRLRKDSPAFRPAFLLSRETAQAAGIPRDDPDCFIAGTLQDEETIARQLYSGLRTLDLNRPTVIYTESFDGQGGLWTAIADRLHRAAEGNVLPSCEVLERDCR